MSRWMRLFVLSLGLSFSAYALPASRIQTEDVLALLKQRPDLYAFVTSTLDLDGEGWGSTVASNNPALWFPVAAPYVIKARPKGSSARWVFLLTIESEVKFLDGQGREVPLEKGTSVQEKLTGIRLRPIEANESRELD